MERGTYVALTSSFAGTGGIPEDMAMGVVACSAARLAGAFVRLKSRMVAVYGSAGGRVQDVGDEVMAELPRWLSAVESEGSGEGG